MKNATQRHSVATPRPSLNRSSTVALPPSGSSRDDLDVAVGAELGLDLAQQPLRFGFGGSGSPRPRSGSTPATSARVPRRAAAAGRRPRRIRRASRTARRAARPPCRRRSRRARCRCRRTSRSAPAACAARTPTRDRSRSAARAPSPRPVKNRSTSNGPNESTQSVSSVADAERDARVDDDAAPADSIGERREQASRRA